MQTTIYKEQAVGINGVISKAESQYLATIQGVLMQDIAIGSAVGFGGQESEFISTGINNSNFVGFVVRDGFINSCETPTETYKKGDTVTVITKGSLFIKSPSNAKQGQFVVIKSDGSIYLSDTLSTVGGEVNTGWRVASGGNESDITEITTSLRFK